MTNRFIKLFSVIALIFFMTPIAGCGGGGSSSPSVGSVRGTLIDGFGAIISSADAVLILEGSGVTGHPDANGEFLLSADPGNYILNASWFNETAGLKLEGKLNVAIAAGGTNNIGTLSISEQSLNSGWASYNAGDFASAETFFLQYLDNVRSGQASIGSASAYCALAWTRGRGLNDPIKASGNFHDALNGWAGNIDAWAGLSGSELALMTSDGDFHFNETVAAVTSAIDDPGFYSSAPTHDDINEYDLQAYRSFVNYLNGNVANARSEALAVNDIIETEGSSAGATTVAVVLRFSE
ncbi:MAG: hypothetical protein NTY09_12250 [bacterium]|nr:hypothetical protein [bacterium]